MGELEWISINLSKSAVFSLQKTTSHLLRISLNGILKLNEVWPLEGAMYISLWENYRGHPDNVSFMHFSTKIDGFEQKDSQGFENSYNSYEQYPLEKFFIFTIYQNYTLALTTAYSAYAVHFFLGQFPNMKLMLLLLSPLFYSLNRYIFAIASLLLIY